MLERVSISCSTGNNIPLTVKRHENRIGRQYQLINTINIQTKSLKIQKDDHNP